MKNSIRWLVLSGLGLLAGAAGAVFEEKDDPEKVVGVNVYAEPDDPRVQAMLRREEARRAEAEKRVEQIRNLPPERVQDWISGKLTEPELDQVVSGPRLQQEPELTVIVPRGRLNRLVLVSAAVIVLTFLYGRQRKRGMK